MRLISRGILALVLGCVFCLNAPDDPRTLTAQTANVVSEPEAYAVYRTLVPITFSSGDTNRTRIALLAETRSYGGCPFKVDSSWQRAWENYKVENASVRTYLPGIRPRPVLRPV